MHEARLASASVSVSGESILRLSSPGRQCGPTLSHMDTWYVTQTREVPLCSIRLLGREISFLHGHECCSPRVGLDHLAPFNRARVLWPRVSGYSVHHSPFAITRSNTHLCKAHPLLWSAMFLTSPPRSTANRSVRRLQTASTSPLSIARPNSPAGKKLLQVTSFPASIPWVPKNRFAENKRWRAHSRHTNPLALSDPQSCEILFSHPPGHAGTAG